MKKSSKREAVEGQDSKEVIGKGYSTAEKTVVQEHRSPVGAALHQLKFTSKKGRDGKIYVAPIGDEAALILDASAKTTGTVHLNLSERLLEQVTLAITSCQDERTIVETLNTVCAALLGIEPTDTLEGLLAAQMVACHNQSMKLLENSLRAEFLPQKEFYLNSANKLMRTFAAQIETLKKYRSGGEQKVTVEHVHVNAGGKAIVGNVQGGGIRRK